MRTPSPAAASRPGRMRVHLKFLLLVPIIYVVVLVARGPRWAHPGASSREGRTHELAAQLDRITAQLHEREASERRLLLQIQEISARVGERLPPDHPATPTPPAYTTKPPPPPEALETGRETRAPGTEAPAIRQNRLNWAAAAREYRAASSWSGVMADRLRGVSEETDCRLTTTGRRCVFPFLSDPDSEFHTRCIGEGDGYCAVSVNVSTGVVLEKQPCGLACVDSGPYSTDFTTTCNAGQTCSCVQGLTVPCGQTRKARCSDVCEAAFRRDSHPAIPSVRYPDAALCRDLTESFLEAAPFDESDITQLKKYNPTSWQEASKYFKGTGIVIGSGGSRLPTAVSNALYIRLVVKSNMPIQIWHAEDEQMPSKGMLLISAMHGISHFRLTKQCGYGSFKWEKRWAKNGEFVLPERTGKVVLKPFVVALSTFSTVVYFDDDALPAVDPTSMVRLLDEHSAVFWRDIWTLWKDASIWTVLDWPGNKLRSYPAQDSGVFIVCKSCKYGWEALATAAYLNFHHLTYYPALYNGGFKANKNGVDAIGSGDKDTFQVAWIARSARGRMMGPVYFVGKLDDDCGAVLGQSDEDGVVWVVHLNGHKPKYWEWQDGTMQQLGQRGLGLQQVCKLKKPARPNRYDGRTRTQVKWKEPEDGNTYCLRFHKQVTEPLSEHIPWDLEGSIYNHTLLQFSQPWMADYMFTVDSGR
ncbi:hypothetical protein DIPPA_23797 [Diplonema papillatum]|nr:hypothetical protein DIPPA_23797 [Diplonema papillatum]